MDDVLAGIDRIVVPAGLNHVTPGTTWWLYAVEELVPDVELERRLLVDSDRIPLDRAARPEHAALLRSIGDALAADRPTTDAPTPDAPIRHVPDPHLRRLLVTCAGLLVSAGVCQPYRRPADYLADMVANGIVVLRLV